VCEYNLNGTSAQLGYYSAIHVGTGLENTLQKLNTTQKKQATQNVDDQYLSDLVASDDTRPGNEVGLLYKTPEPTQGTFDAKSESLR